VLDRVRKHLWLLVVIPVLVLSVRVHLEGQPDGGLDHDEVIAMMAICGTQARQWCLPLLTGHREPAWAWDRIVAVVEA
jgi:hypothetical protein